MNSRMSQLQQQTTRRSLRHADTTQEAETGRSHYEGSLIKSSRAARATEKSVLKNKNRNKKQKKMFKSYH